MDGCWNATVYCTDLAPRSQQTRTVEGKAKAWDTVALFPLRVLRGGAERGSHVYLVFGMDVLCHACSVSVSAWVAEHGTQLCKPGRASQRPAGQRPGACESNALLYRKIIAVDRSRRSNFHSMF